MRKKRKRYPIGYEGKFGKLMIIGWSEPKLYCNGKVKSKVARCLCDCGTEREVNYSSLIGGYTSSCGCKLKEKQLSCIGKKFGKLKIIEYSEDYIDKKGRKYSCIRCLCDCGNTVEKIKKSVLSGDTISCGCESKKIYNIGDIFGKLKIIDIYYSKINNKNRKIGKCECICGNITEVVLTSLSSGNTTSCGCLRKNSLPRHINQKFNKLTIIGWKRTGKNRRDVECLCECGNKCVKTQRAVITGYAKSCGCERKEEINNRCKKLIGTKIGKLEILSINETRGKFGQVMLNVKCECGGSNIVTYGSLNKKTTQSCGNCDLKVNGKYTSRIGLKLHKIINLGEHNHYTGVLAPTKSGKGNYNINVDIAFPNEKIAIEYDGWYWHKDSKEKDQLQTEALINEGWRVLRIKSRRLLPTKEQIEEKLQLLRNGSPLEIIIMEDWE